MRFDEHGRALVALLVFFFMVSDWSSDRASEYIDDANIISTRPSYDRLPRAGGEGWNSSGVRPRPRESSSGAS